MASHDSWAGDTSTITVVFKTHLDIGFTDLAGEVRRSYHEEYIPAAIRLARDLEHEGGPARFVWTTGSWLIDEHLREAPARDRSELERAIDAGHVAWHALPFTTHSELLDPELFTAGLAISERLDQRFGRSTVAAKMTDVPGHTLGIVPLLAGAGVRYLHVGVNPSSARPDVPEIFCWRAPDGSRIVVHYSADYGSDRSVTVIPGTGQALYFAQTGDNHGPPTTAEVSSLFDRLASSYPGSRLRAGRMDDAVAGVDQVRDTLPQVTAEIGDTWIHGPGSDPVLTRDFRRLQALRTRWLADGTLQAGSPMDAELAGGLLLVPEHTWGRDVKRYLPDYVSWSKADFAAARRRDVIDISANPPEAEPYLRSADRLGRYGYAALEESWREQRSYVTGAIAALDGDLREAAERVLAPPSLLPGTGSDITPGEWIGVGDFRLRFDVHGAISGLVHESSARTVADPTHRLGVFRYEQFAAGDYERWLASYQRDLDRHSSWAIPDFAKPGMDRLDPPREHTSTEPVCVGITRRDGADTVALSVSMRYPRELTDRTGAPREIGLDYLVRREGGQVGLRLSWRGKDADRLPEATWLSFQPLVADPSAWRLRKLGIDIDPSDVVSRGNRSLHAVTAAAYAGPDGVFELHTPDTPLVAPGERRLLRFDDSLPDLTGGMHVNLHNNVWGTNFRLWFEDDLQVDLGLVLS